MCKIEPKYEVWENYINGKYEWRIAHDCTYEQVEILVKIAPDNLERRIVLEEKFQ